MKTTSVLLMLVLVVTAGPLAYAASIVACLAASGPLAAYATCMAACLTSGPLAPVTCPAFCAPTLVARTP